MKWEPSDVIRLVALVGGFLLCTIGAVLMWLGVGAEGAVDIKSSALSGTVKTGSAGLFLLFFGCAIVLSVLATLTSKASAAHVPPVQRQSKTKSIGRAFGGLLCATVISGTLGALGNGPGFGILAMALGMFALFTGIAYLEFASRE